MNVTRYTTSCLLFQAAFILGLLPIRAQDNGTFIMEPVGTEAFEVMRQFFNYDETMPLDVRVVESQDEEDYVREKIVFNGVQDSRVPGILAIPKNGDASHPCVLLLHGLDGSKDNWWRGDRGSKTVPERLLESGYAVLSLDAQYHGERLLNNDFESAGVFTFDRGWRYRARDMIVQSTVEYRRALDYLCSRNDIDTTRLGVVGYSMGGMMTFFLSGTEHRIRASVACVTPTYRDPFSAIAPHNFAPFIVDKSILMLMGKEDQFYTIEEAQRLHDLIGSETKELVFYDSGHGLPEEWVGKAIEWFEAYL